ncbi:3-dehydroquinate synthase II family protein [Phytohabitans sp. ZYX-F-186]|uniref:3-dehydroquinate synthase II family protein n=1 Tax=Phytohabitans maris TaxID=3071409 RepID=A0ABU0ZF43_9ACTN|nr:3-dehydroquinate synthase II family protein [Phytohabitans sp. ZYX-F-186]MDQ7905670.1 3-dehydroquinate synthase II family protein [Phytohabitans sp. ZYX-F-186]
MKGEQALKQCWLDIRSAGEFTAALCQEALHHGFDAIVAADPADLAPLPPAVTRVLLPSGADLPADFGVADLVVVDPVVHGTPEELAQRHPDRRFGVYVEVTDKESLERACASVRRYECTVLRFRDPTNIPLEIVLAAAAATHRPGAAAPGLIITAMDRVADAPVHLGVLEHGPGGLMLAPTAPGEAARLRDVVTSKPEALKLVTLTVTAITHAGMGERACVDTCTYLEKDEGILVGSRAKGMVLCVSETHPLPYMPTRPFRVNAGAIMSYTLADPEHTRYLSELGAGDTVLAVGADGRTRHAIVGRVKIETRPLLSIDAVSDDGERVNVIVQDDWHVRILGPGAAVLNSTALRPGDQILGHLPRRERHVGYPIDEFCHEQ